MGITQKQFETISALLEERKSLEMQLAWVQEARNSSNVKIVATTKDLSTGGSFDQCTFRGKKMLEGFEGVISGLLVVNRDKLEDAGYEFGDSKVEQPHA